MTGEELQSAYGKHLERMLEPGYPGRVNKKSTRAMLKETRANRGGEHTPKPGERTWIWSDLHLHHANIIRYCDRPFDSADAMNRALFAAWVKTVGETDTVICGGDVAMGGALKGDRIDAVRKMPGRKLLVRGNHDFDRRGRPLPTGCDAAWMTLLIPGDPPLFLTHIPMGEVPAGGVNLYGHVHNEPLRHGPRVNICVEHTEYRPLPLEVLRRLARARLEDPRPRGETTADEIRSLGN